MSAIGFGAWGLSGPYGEASDSESTSTLHRALDLGINHIDTADSYGDGHNEELVGKGIRGRRDGVVLATKFGMVREPGRPLVTVCGRPEYVRAAIERSLSRLGTDYVDLYYLHRLDPDTPIEVTVGAMAELVEAGLVRHLGLSEVSAETIRRAATVHPIAAVQSEFSLWTREPEETVLPALRELGISLVAFSPLGRGFLAAGLSATASFAAGDYRRGLPRFAAQNLDQNQRLADRLRELADARDVEPAQLALAWLLHQGDDVLPIPGTRRTEHLDANAAAAGVTLTRAELSAIEEIFGCGAVAGERYPPELDRLVDHGP